MKTSIQEFYESLEEAKKLSDSISITDIQRMLSYHLEKEKQQIIDAHEKGQSIYSDIIRTKKSNGYYSETFNNND